MPLSTLATMPLLCDYLKARVVKKCIFAQWWIITITSKEEAMNHKEGAPIEIGLRTLSSRAGICLFSGNSLYRDTGAKLRRKHIVKIEKFSIYRTQIAVKSITKLVQSRFAHILEPQNIENISSP